MESAFNHGGFDMVILGFLAGGLVFVVSDLILIKTGGRNHKRRQFLVPNGVESDGRAMTLGAILDAIPEAIAIGVATFAGNGTGVLMAVAIVLANIPEGLSSVPGLIREGFSKKKIIAVWLTAAIITLIGALVSFVFLHKLDPNILGFLESFSAGAILAMIADTMMPEAYEEGGFVVGILTVFGFLIAFILSRV